MADSQAYTDTSKKDTFEVPSNSHLVGGGDLHEHRRNVRFTFKAWKSTTTVKTDKSDKPTSVTPDHFEEYADKIAWCGEDNNYYENILSMAHASSEIPSTIEQKSKGIVAGDIIYTDVENDSDGDEITPFKKNKEADRFTKRNKIRKTLFAIANDFFWFYLSFVEVILNPDRTKIVSIRHLKTCFCRFEKMNPKTGQIEHIYYSANWGNINAENKDYVSKIKLLPDFDTINFIRNDPEKSLKYAYCIMPYSANRIYYPLVPWHSIFPSKWFGISQKIATYADIKLDDGMFTNVIVTVSSSYWTTKYEDWSTKPEKKEERKGKLTDEISAFLLGLENSGKPYFTGTYTDDISGEERPFIKIETLDNKLLDSEFLKFLNQATVKITYALGFDARIGGVMPNSSEGLGANGTEIREAYNVFLILNRPFQEFFLEPFSMALQYNIDENLEYKIKNPTLQTKDQITPQKREISDPILN